MNLRVFWPCLAFAVLLPRSTVTATAPQGSRYTETYPAVDSKKGLQVEWVDDVLQLGIRHATFNVDLCALVDPTGDPDNPSWDDGQQLYHFRRSALDSLDRRIKSLSDRGVLVNLILLTYHSGDEQINRLMLHPDYVTDAPNRLGAFNTATVEGRDWFVATLSFLAERWSRPDRKYGRVVGYILGNEVNSHWWWSNMGRVTMEQFADDYVRTVRLAHEAIRQQSSWARLYISLEHHWNIRYPAGDSLQAFPGRAFVEYFAKRARQEGDFDWHLAFHPYPENLFEPRFWQDTSATLDSDTPRITFKNLEVLVAFMKQPSLHYQDQPRRIILSEQGFHTPAGPDGEKIQAAAYCYAYRKVATLDEIDAFILHRHIDNDHEGGLLLGLRRNRPARGEDLPQKKIYECFRAADTPQWESDFKFALPIVGIESWDSIYSNK